MLKMKVEITVPTAGESVTEAEIAKWLKQSGDNVKLDDVILELETEKATLEVNAEMEGKLTILATEGETVSVGQVVGIIDSEGTNSTSPKQEILANLPKDEKKSRNTSMGRRLDILVPSAGESVSEANIAEWHKKNGDEVVMDEVLLELETDKASLEITAEADGKLNIKVEDGLVKVGDVLGSIIINEKGNSDDQISEKKKETIVEEKSLNSPPSNKILTPKVKPVSGQMLEKVASTPNLKIKGTRGETRQPMTRLRKTIAGRLVDAQRTAAMLTTFNEVDMLKVMNIRQNYKERFKSEYDVGLGFMSFFTKAVCSALSAWPVMNAFIENNDIIYHDYCDIGVAVSTPKGLVVPVVRNAERMTFYEIEASIATLGSKGREGKLTADDMTGGTFTITNGGVFGSMLSTPILNKPQSGILGMHNIIRRPVAIGDSIEIRPMMYLAVTYDHRLIDGAEAVQFLVRIKECVEDPDRILLKI